MKPERVINIHGHLRHDQDLAARVRIWEEWNVVRFCCQCLPGGGGVAFGNDDFLAAKREYPDLLVGFAAASLSGPHPDTAADIFRYKEQGFAGLKFINPAYAYNHEAYYPLYEAAAQLGMPILFHTGYLGHNPKEPDRTGTDAENMSAYKFDKIARAFPSLKIIGAHLGHPEMKLALYLSEFFPNLYWDMTGGGGRTPHVRMMLEALLPHPALKTDMANPLENRALLWFTKLVFGTDNPEPGVWVPACEYIMDTLEIPPDIRRKFYYETAAGLLA